MLTRQAVVWMGLALALAALPPPSVMTRRLRRSRPPAPGIASVVRSPARRGDVPVLAASVAVVALAAVVAVGALRGAAPASALAVAVGTAGLLTRRSSRARRAARAEDTLAAATRLLVAELEAGEPPDQALGAAAALAVDDGAELLAGAEAYRRGLAPDWTGRLAPLGHAWRLALTSGAPVATALSRVAADLDARAHARRSVGSALAGARSSAALLAGLPVLGIALGAAMQADPVGTLLDTGAGRLLLLAGVVMDCAGLLWTARLAARAVSP